MSGPGARHEAPQALWRPTPERAAASQMEAFRRAASTAAGRDLSDYDALHAWSVAEPERFWDLLATHLELPFASRGDAALSGHPMPHTRWFEGSTLNYAEALLYPPRLLDPDRAAVIALSEANLDAPVRLSYRELRALVARAQLALVNSGVGRGDCVAAFAANVPETLAVLLACSGLGALFASCSPDFGVDAAVARFGQLSPKLLFATTSYRYAGKSFDVTSTALSLASRLAVPLVALPAPPPEPGVAEPRARLTAWQEWLEAAPLGGEEPSPTFAELPFDQPLYVLFSSGTTGAPKALVHRAGGALLTHAKEHRLHLDVRAGDVAFYYTTCGWMMWNWLVSALAQAATVVLFDGSPAPADEPDALLGVCDRLGVTLFGTSARYLHGLMAAGVKPGERRSLTALRTLAVTGSPLSTAGYRWVYQAVKSDLHLASISGGTDIVGCFVLGVPTLPVYAGEIQRPGLGVDLAVLSDAGEELTAGPGELVCRQPLPSMPLRLAGDEDGSRYHAAYFERFPGVWHHGDLVERTATGGVIVHGRSDATLNPGGVRIGTAEIYRPLEEAFPEVVEAAAVAKRTPGGFDQEVWLFVVLRAGVELTAKLATAMRSELRRAASPRHVPKRIFRLSELPRTRSGKPMELAVTRIVNGMQLSNAEVVANPAVLEEIERAAEDPESGL